MAFRDSAEPMMHAYPRCAVLLAVFNGMRYIEEQIKTILNQTQVEVTLFINVDSSSDGSENWLEQLAAKEKRIVLLPFGLSFGGAAKNFFYLIKEVDFSSFDFIAFADQDDLWLEDKLHKAVMVLADPSFDAYSSNVIAFWPNGKKILIDKAQPQKNWDFMFEAAGPGCTYVFSLKLMTAIKACLSSYWEQVQTVTLHDWFCYAFARAQGYHWFIDPYPSMLYRQHDKNQVGVNLGLKAYSARLRLIKSGWWLTQAQLIAEIVEVNHPFINKGSKINRFDLIRLAMRAAQYRRSLSEQLIFFCMCIVFVIRRTKQSESST